jgi:CheY-like chemotaxis protein
MMKSKNKESNLPDNFNQGRVLLAEDSVISAVHAESILKDLKLKIDVVQNGMEALRKTQENRYDILLLDIYMPEMDGLEATKHIRLMEPARWRTPILILSSHPIEVDFLESNDIDDVVVKPFSREELAGKIFKYITRNSN